jgi:hypothetical protein
MREDIGENQMVEFERDEWVQVKTLSAESARRFFGKPADWPVREVPNTLDEVDGRRLFEVKADR